MSHPIYLNYNATTPLSELVKAELVRLLPLDLGNPSSRHWAGAPAAEIVELSRISIASLIGCDPTEIIFTSGGTEANNHAIKGVFFANRQRLSERIKMSMPLSLLCLLILVIGPCQGWMVANAQETVISKGEDAESSSRSITLNR